VLTDLLRGGLGFRGVVVSDALMMGALAGVDAGERAARALQAGVDCLLYPPDPCAAVQGLARRLEDESLAPAVVERALANLRAALARVEAPPGRPERRGPARPAPGEGALPADGATDLALRAARAGLVRVGAPTPALEEPALVVVLLDGGIDRGGVILPSVAAGPGRDFAWLVPGEGSADLPPGLDAYRSLALAYFSPIRAWKGRAGFSPEAARIAAALFARRPDATLISFGSPFIVRDVPALRSALLAFGDVPACQIAVGEVLTGGTKPGGRLPVRL
jgi:hypothetical protein